MISPEEDRVLNELELEVVKQFVLEGLVYAIKQGQIDRDKAADLVCLWFEGDKVALSSLYRQVSVI